MLTGPPCVSDMHRRPQKTRETERHEILGNIQETNTGDWKDIKDHRETQETK